MKRTILFLIVFLLITFTVLAKVNLPEKERPDLWDGHDWKKMTFEQKLYYVSGVTASINDFVKQMYQGDENAPLIKNDSIEQMIQTIDQEYSKGNLNATILELDIMEE